MTATYRCYAAVAACYLMKIGVGLLSAYPSTALPDIASGNYGFKMGDSSMEAWFASGTRLSGLLACLVIAPLMDTYGRKATFMLFALLNAIGWLVSIAAHHAATLFVGNVIVSIAGEAQTVLAAICVAEITPKEIRGSAMSGNYGTLLVGVALSYILGAFLNWRYLALVGLANGLLIAIGGLLFLPETPRWLLMHGMGETARFNLRRLRHYPEDVKEDPVEEEMAEMEERLRATVPTSCLSGLSVLVGTSLIRPLLISQFVIIFQQFSANGYIKTFTVTIFKMTGSGSGGGGGGGVLGDPHYQTIIVGLCAVAGGILSMTVMDRWGRRPCLILSSSLIALSLTGLGTYFWLHANESHWTSAHLQWLPLICLIVFEIAYGLGLGPIPFILMSEMFPTRVRSVATAMATLTFSLVLFAVVKVSGSLYIKTYTMFWIYGGVSLVGVIFMIAFVPETKGQTLESVEKMWTKDNVGKASAIVNESRL